jgi:DNA polymerase-3 subunit delta
VIILLHGADQLAIDRRMRELKDQADGGSGMLQTNIALIDGRDAKPFDILGPAMSPPFLAPHRLVVVEHLLERYDGSGGGEPRRGTRSADAMAPLLKGIESGLPPSTILVFLAGKLDRRNSLLERLKKLPGVTNEEKPELKGEQFMRFIRDEANFRGIRIRPGPPRQHHPASEEWERGAANDPVALIALLTHGNTLQASNELDKLALYSLGRDVTVDDVYEICSGDREFSSFQFTDAIMDGKLLDALAALEFLRADGVSMQAMLGMLLGAYRRVALIADLLETGATPDDVGRIMNIKFPGLRDAAIRRARRLGPAGLRDAYASLVDADRRHKLGEIDDDLALEVVIVKLATEAATANRRTSPSNRAPARR